MFLANELNGTLTFLHILVALVFGIAPVALTVAIKVVLYRRRLAEDEAVQQDEASEGAHVKPILGRPTLRRDRRRTRLVRPLPASFRAEQPLALFVAEPRARAPRDRAETEIETKATLAA